MTASTLTWNEGTATPPMPRPPPCSSNIYNTVKHYDATKHMNICLPGMTSRQRLGGRRELVCLWGPRRLLRHGVHYELRHGLGRLRAGAGFSEKLAGGHLRLRHHGSWTRIRSFLGYAGLRLELADLRHAGEPGREPTGAFPTPTTPRRYWMTGAYNFTGDAPPQPFLPIVAYWDDYDKVPYAFPHVYDYMEGADAVSREYPSACGHIQPQALPDCLRQGAEDRVRNYFHRPGR